MIILLIIIGIIVCLGFGGWCGKLGCQSCEEEVKVLRRKLYECELAGKLILSSEHIADLKKIAKSHAKWRNIMIKDMKELGIEFEDDKEA